MKLLALGVSHHSAPVELREKMAFAPERIPALLAGLQRAGLGQESVLLSTCNRVELYTVPGRQVGGERLATWLAETAGMGLRAVDSHLYRFEEQAAVKHLFRVVSSLDSLIVGEPQIVGQVKDAYQVAKEHRSVGPVLHQVMDRALHVAKRVRTETDIAREAVSVGRAGVELARQVLGDLDGRAALLIGAGAHGKLVARSLIGYGLGELVVANRTFSKAVELAKSFGGSAVHLDDFPLYLDRVDVVLCSTAAGRVLIERADIAPVMRRRRYRSLVMIDLSVPRNVSTEVNEVEGVYRFDVDDLVQIADRGLEKRRNAAQSAERIVAEEVDRCWSELQGEAVHRSIGRLTRHANEIREAELLRNRAILDALPERERQAIEAMTRSIVKKLLHQPISHLREAAGDGRDEAVDEVVRAMVGRTSEES